MGAYAKVVVVGQGYVGLPLALAIARAGHEVIGFDTNKELISRLCNGLSHVDGVENDEIVSCINSGSYRASCIESDISDCEIALIAVPTPLDDKSQPNLQLLIEACKILGSNLKGQALIVNESTSYPGTLRRHVKKTVEAHSSSDFEHLYAISPERVDPGNKVWNIKNTPRLISGLTSESTRRAVNFYSTFCDSLHTVSTPEVAESAKLMENTFRLVNISLVNELAILFESLGIPIRETIEAAATKPFGFMKFSPSAGAGGHCIPIDPIYLADVARESGKNPQMIDLAIEINRRMPEYIVNRIKKDHRGSLKNKTVRLIGVSYKPNVADTRESPASTLKDELEKEGATVTWHDPFVKTWRGQGSSILSPMATDVAIILTYHDDFNKEEIFNSSKYTFDCTGTVTEATQM